MRSCSRLARPCLWGEGTRRASAGARRCVAMPRSHRCLGLRGRGERQRAPGGVSRCCGVTAVWGGGDAASVSGRLAVRHEAAESPPSGARVGSRARRRARTRRGASQELVSLHHSNVTAVPRAARRRARTRRGAARAGSRPRSRARGPVGVRDDVAREDLAAFRRRVSTIHHLGSSRARGPRRRRGGG